MSSQFGSTLDADAHLRAHEAVSLRARKFPADALRQLAEEVLTRLASRFQSAPLPLEGVPSDDAIDALAESLISSDSNEGLSFVISLQKQGVCKDTIYLGYLAGAARRLGERWVEDTLSFADVTLGAGRLYIILRALRPVFTPPNFCPKTARTALFCSAPGEDHVLGVTMATDMFRERGWTIDLRTGISHDELVQAATERCYPIIGLSASSRRMVLPLTRLIASLRVVNPASYILVSGELTALEENLGKIVDADFVAHDAPEAITELHRFAATLETN